MKLNSIRLGNNDIESSIRELLHESSSLKSNLFKMILSEKGINKIPVQRYLGVVNSFLKSWSEFAETLKSRIKTSDVSEHPYGHITYAEISNYLYPQYDYAAILQYTDGVINGIESHKFTDEDDISKFFDSTISLAFKNRADSVGGLVNEVLDMNTGVSFNLPTKEISLYKGVKAQNLFNGYDRNEIYKAIEKVLDWLTYDLNKNRAIRMEKPRIGIAIINTVIEFMTFTLTAYATRIFAIQAYVYQFVLFKKAFDESVEADTGRPKISELEISIMRETDENIARDYNKLDEITTRMIDWLKILGTTNDLILDYDASKICYSSYCNKENNEFFNKLFDNGIVEFISNRKTWFSDHDTDKEIIKYIQDLDDLIHNGSMGMANSFSQKQGLIHVIRGVNPDEKHKTVEAYTKIAEDLVIFSLFMLSSITNSINRISNGLSNENHIQFTNRKVYNQMQEGKGMLIELYKDIASATLGKARGIEAEINWINNAKNQNMMAELKLRVPGFEDEEPNGSIINSMAPEATRMPPNVDDIYELPSFEAFRMYDEYVKSLPGMANVYYYNEALDISGLIDRFMAWIRGLTKRMGDTFNNAQFKAAVEWVNKHKGELPQLKYNGVLEVLPYQKVISIEFMNKAVATMKDGFKPEAFKSGEDVNKYLQTIYACASPKFAQLFVNGSMDNERVITLYRNWVMFGTDPSANNATVQPKRLQNEQINTEVQMWVETVADASNIYAAIGNINRDIESAINDMKGKMARLSANKPAETTTEAPPANPVNNSGNPSNTTQSQPNNTQNNKPTPENDFSTMALSKAQLAMGNLWDSITKATVQALRDQYKYIQEAYTIGRKTNTTETATTTTNTAE